MVRAFFDRALRPGFATDSSAAEPAVSIDGTVACTTGVLDALCGRPRTRIVVVDFEAQTLSAIHADGTDQRTPHFSPDGSALIFQSTRLGDGSYQLSIASRANAFRDAVPLCDLPGTVEYASFSPDGRSIVAGVAAAGSDFGGSEGSGIAMPPKRGARWEPWVVRGVSPDKHEEAPDHGRSLYIIDVATRASRRIAFSGSPWDAAWCGNAVLVVIASTSPLENSWYSSTLQLVAVDSGHAQTVRTPRRQLASPACAADGARIAWIEAVCSDRKVVAGDVFMRDMQTEEVRKIPTGKIDVTYIAFANSDRLFFIGQRGLRTAAGIYDVVTACSTEMWDTEESCGRRYPSAAVIDARSFVTVLESFDRYPSIARIESGAATAGLSLAHAGTADIRRSMNRIEPYHWTGRDGLPLEGLLIRPHGPAPHPLVINVHGGPIFAWRNLWSMGSTLTALLVSRGYAVLHPNPRGSSGRGQAFAEMVVGDICGEETFDHLRAVDALIAEGIADAEHVAVMGVSHGGQMTSWLVTQTDRFAAAIAISPFTNFLSARYGSNMGIFFPMFLRDEPLGAGKFYDRSPVYRASYARTPTLIMAGDLDRCTPPAQSIEFHRALTEHGVPSELVIYPEEGHGIRNISAQIDQADRITTWLKTHASPPKKPPTPHLSSRA